MYFLNTDIRSVVASLVLSSEPCFSRCVVPGVINVDVSISCWMSCLAFGVFQDKQHSVNLCSIMLITHLSKNACQVYTYYPENINLVLVFVRRRG